MDKFKFLDENGVEHNFEIIDFFEVDDDEYAVIQPDDMEESLLLKVDYDENGESFLCEIESQKEFDEVSTLYLELLDEKE
ncbi:DUF1292 domain-containing protein [Senegalia massiliensis]|uniref:DUF1292 domain-containing protein n=1 Tax=Senegalia massiliensis TaxID=1720316 RepID=UPI00102F7103|nr:DUF1292 domain-containing protein [Senegalia massiliensis]